MVQRHQLEVLRAGPPESDELRSSESIPVLLGLPLGLGGDRAAILLRVLVAGLEPPLADHKSVVGRG